MSFSNYRKYLLLYFTFPALLIGQNTLPTQPRVTVPRTSVSGTSVTRTQTPEEARAAYQKLQETIKQAGVDLKSKDENLRESAAKLLGKYRTSQAGELLLAALSDQSVKVRRAAVHSLVEAMSLYSVDRNEKLFAMLGDPDVEIRRKISASIPTLRSRLFLNRSVTITRNGKPYTQTIPYRLPPNLQKAIHACLDDEDSIVRLNMLKNYIYLNLPMDAAMLERRLEDSDRNVIDVALDRIRILPRTPGIYEKLKKIAQGEDVGLRRKLITSTKGLREPEIHNIQRDRLKDPDPFVRNMSAVALASAGEKLPESVPQDVVDFLMKVDFTNSQIMSLLYSLNEFGEPTARKIFTQLTQHRTSRIRSYAWQRVLNYDNSWTNPKVWMPVLEDTDKQVRNMVIGVVGGNRVPVPVDYIETLIESEYPDVRALAGRLLVRHTPEIVEEWMFDLLIDDDVSVRRSILQTIASAKVEDWDSIMEKSLSDEDFSIQRTAAYSLLANYPASKPTLEKFVSQNPTNPVAADISGQLKQRQ